MSFGFTKTSHEQRAREKRIIHILYMYKEQANPRATTKKAHPASDTPLRAYRLHSIHITATALGNAV